MTDREVGNIQKSCANQAIYHWPSPNLVTSTTNGSVSIENSPNNKESDRLRGEATDDNFCNYANKGSVAVSVFKVRVRVVVDGGIQRNER